MSRQPNEDRVLDAMLEELHGRAAPPDLSARIEAELRGPQRHEFTGQARPAPNRGPAALWFAAGCLASLIVWASLDLDDRAGIASVTIDVVRGDALCDAVGDAPLRVGVPERVDLTIGHRFSSTAGAELELRPFGTLELSRHSIVEIESMEWTRRDGALVVGSLAFGAVAGAFVWDTLDAGSDVAAQESRTTSKQGSSPAVPADAEMLARLREQIAKLEADNAELRALNERRVVAEAVVADPTEAPASDPERQLELLRAGGFSDALAQLDWALIGRTTHEMVPVLTRLAEALANGEEPSLAEIAEIQRLNASLLGEAGRVMEAGVEGFGVNGAYTHPSVAGNQIMATLAAAGLDLNPTQRLRLGELMDEYGAIDRNIRLDADGHEIKLANLLAEIDYKTRFFDEVRGMLDTDQVGVLTNDTVDGRLRVGLYGPSLVLSQVAKPVPVESPSAMSDAWSRELGDVLQLGEAGAADIRRVVDDWVGGLPDTFWQDTPDSLEQSGHLRAERVRQAAHAQFALVQRVLQEFGTRMSPSARAELVENLQVLVPLPR